MLGSIRRPEEEEVFGVQDWAEVHRLHREGVPKRVIARRLGMSHTTVHRLLGLATPPSYERTGSSSLVAPFTDEIAAMLHTDPKVPATVVLQHLRRSGYAGCITILKEHLAQVRPAFLAACAGARGRYLLEGTDRVGATLTLAIGTRRHLCDIANPLRPAEVLVSVSPVPSLTRKRSEVQFL
jgi:hypothetical protein